MTPIALRILDAETCLRNVRMRLPFRYGKAVLVAAPLLHLRLVCEAGGRRIEGVAADMLPPKWFDKRADRSYADNIAGLRRAVAIAAAEYGAAAAAPVTPFAAWRAADPAVRLRAAAEGLNGLTAQFGSSMLERALIDAACRAAGRPFHAILRDGALGLPRTGALPDAPGVALGEAVPAAPLGVIHVRHTIGLGDPLFDADLEPGAAAGDRLPRSVEAWMRHAGVRHFKIKLTSNIEADLERLERLAQLFAAQGAMASVRLTLDGNEQFQSFDALAAWYGALRACNTLAPLLERVLFIEQPIERAHTFDVPVDPAAGLPPLLIDEADDTEDAFARAAALGYRGVSVKNCKGVFKAVLNALRARHLSAGAPGAFFLSGEDLCNQPIVPLQQDLCTMAALGIDHVERNGHHYCGTLAHVPPAGVRGALDAHASLYEPFDETARLRIRNGMLDVSSLQCAGFGVGSAIDFASMTPDAEWRFESLGIDE